MSKILSGGDHVFSRYIKYHRYKVFPPQIPPLNYRLYSSLQINYTSNKKTFPLSKEEHLLRNFSGNKSANMYVNT
jgi:hypothetical protein